MDKDEQLRQEAKRELESAAGGRYRDGAECPLVFDIYAQAAYQLGVADQPRHSDQLLDHLELCAVCRSIYQSALSAGEQVEAVDDTARTQHDSPAANPQPDTTSPGIASLVDNLRQLFAKPEQVDTSYESPEPLSIPVFETKARESASQYAMALNTSSLSRPDSETAARVHTIQIESAYILSGDPAKLPKRVRIRFGAEKIEMRLLDWQAEMQQRVQATLLNATGRELARLTSLQQNPSMLSLDQFNGSSDVNRVNIVCLDAQNSAQWQIEFRLPG